MLGPDSKLGERLQVVSQHRQPHLGIGALGGLTGKPLEAAMRLEVRRHDAGADGRGEPIPGGIDQGQIRVGSDRGNRVAIVAR